MLINEEESSSNRKRRHSNDKENEIESSCKRRLTVRRQTPSVVNPENSEKFQCSLPERSSSRRQKETLDACKAIHGDLEGKQSALDGMWVTLVNKTSPEMLKGYLLTSPKVNNKIIPSMLKSQSQAKLYENSKDNTCRSLKVLYERGLLTKEKYKSICRNMAAVSTSVSSSTDSEPNFSNVYSPKLVYYDKLIAFIKSIDMGNIKDFAVEFCHGFDRLEEQVNGSYRELGSFLKVLAELYILVDQALGSESFWLHFGSAPYHFRIALGADGAPFGKDDEATAWLVSFLNVGKHVQSQSDNFLICGANCSENHISMQRYARKLVSDIAQIEKQTYSINGFDVKFTVDLLPCDMKWLSLMGGELNNAAYYFSPFGDVNNDNKIIANGSLGDDISCSWHPWVYEKRIEVVEKVTQKREQLEKKKCSQVTKRNNLLAYIREQKSRQESQPQLGKLIDLGLAEPLHNANNAWGYLHSLMLEIALSKSKIVTSCSDIDSLPVDSPFVHYLVTLKEKLKVTRLVKKVKCWFSEGRKKSFAYRFTGKETKVFCHQFIFVLHSLSSCSDGQEMQLRIAAIAYCCVQLRDAVSYFSRVNIDQDGIDKCKKACQYFFNANMLLLNKITPTIWTIGYAIPRHVQIIFDKYGLGLGLNSMQGREAKHVRLAQYAKHSTKTTRWHMVLRHDYIANVWIRKQDPCHTSYTKYSRQYIPQEVTCNSPTFCYCGFPLENGVASCSICTSDIFKAVQQSAVAGSLVGEICNHIKQKKTL